MLELARFALDPLRGVPDFAWAILILTIPGPGPVTGALAIGVSVAGILGKIYSEHWDSIEARRLAPVLATGSGRTGLLLYLLQPLTSRAMQTFTLMRAECAVRNASVIGVIGGGGLGSAIWDLYADNDYPAIATVFLSLLLLTAGADLVANLLRHQLRVDHNHPRLARQLTLATTNRRRLFSALVVVVLLALSAWRLWPSVLDTLAMAAEHACDRDVVQHRHRLERLRDLMCAGDAEMRPDVWGRPMDRAPIEEDLAGIVVE